MLVKNGTGYSSCSRIFHPYCPSSIVLKRCAEDVALFAVFGKGLSPMGLFMDKCFHADGHKGCSIVIMLAVDVRICRDLGIDVRLPKEKELSFHLWQCLAPEMEGESVRGSAEDPDEVILPSLDGFFSNVATVIIRRHQLICHACGLDFCFVGF